MAFYNIKIGNLLAIENFLGGHCPPWSPLGYGAVAEAQRNLKSIGRMMETQIQKSAAQTSAAHFRKDLHECRNGWMMVQDTRTRSQTCNFRCIRNFSLDKAKLAVQIYSCNPQQPTLRWETLSYWGIEDLILQSL